ncbi:MAG: replication-associated recombination protein A [Candidatus Komeilibacteria bacterium]|nr:replication-associated recombination protein A [Candidatus Komeilibacteria bacterium]
MNQSPLADRLRPTTWDEFVGQEKIVGEQSVLRRSLAQKKLPSLILWGPPGSGKTTLAHIIASELEAEFQTLSAVTTGIADLKKIVAAAWVNQEDKKTLLFIDEIHRWNKAQQDALLPHVEKGTVILIGATTENPSFEIISALLSRSRVFVLQALTPVDISQIISRALTDQEKGLGKLSVELKEADKEWLAQMANGDARTALNTLELAVNSFSPDEGTLTLTRELLLEALQQGNLYYDKTGEEHYNIISALHKSLRGSDADAALYWLGRMLEAGEKPLYVARRLIRFASEDVGLANSQALEQCVAAYQACHFIGMPECELALAQAVVYLAKCKKSNQLYKAYGEVKKDVQKTLNQPVPLHLRNAPTKLMNNIGYGKDYKYSPDFDYAEEQEYLPPELKGKKYL